MKSIANTAELTNWQWGNFFVRTTGNPAFLIKSFTEEIRSSDKTVPVTDIQPLEDAISSTFAQTRFYAFHFALFGATGLMLTLTGIYSVVSCLMTSLLFGVTAGDPATFGAVILLLATVALIACLFPARRATKVDPLIALRYE